MLGIHDRLQFASGQRIEVHLIADAHILGQIHGLEPHPACVLHHAGPDSEESHAGFAGPQVESWGLDQPAPGLFLEADLHRFRIESAMLTLASTSSCLSKRTMAAPSGWIAADVEVGEAFVPDLEAALDHGVPRGPHLAVGQLHRRLA